MIERTYSAYISHHADGLLRAGMLDLDVAPAAPNVVNDGELAGSLADLLTDRCA
jgi:hypothetical protein